MWINTSRSEVLVCSLKAVAAVAVSWGLSHKREQLQDVVADCGGVSEIVLVLQEKESCAPPFGGALYKLIQAMLVDHPAGLKVHGTPLGSSWKKGISLLWEFRCHGNLAKWLLEI